MLNQNMLLNAKNRVAINWTGPYSLSFSKSYGYAYDSIDTVSKPGFTSSYIYVDDRSYSPALLSGDRIPTNGTTGTCSYGEYWRSGRSGTLSVSIDTSTNCKVVSYSSTVIKIAVYVKYSTSYSGFNYVTPSTTSNSSSRYQIELKPTKSISNTTTSATWVVSKIDPYLLVWYPSRTSYYGSSVTHSYSSTIFSNSTLNSEYINKQSPSSYFVSWSAWNTSASITAYSGTAKNFNSSYNNVAYSSLPSGCRVFNTSGTLKVTCS